MKTYLTRRFLAATFLAIGFGLAWGGLTGWIGTSALDAWSGSEGRHAESLVVAADGTPVIQDYSLDNLTTVSYRDLVGVERDEPLESKNMARSISLSGEREPEGFWSSPDRWGRIWTFVNEREPVAVWYLMSDGRSPASGWFVGYERISNRLIGYIGLAGFREQPVPPEERLPLQANSPYGLAYCSLPTSINMNGNWTPTRPDANDVPPRLVHVPSGNLLRVVDLAERTTTVVFEAPAPIDSVGVPMLSAYYGYEPPKEWLVLVRAGGKVYKLDRAYKTVRVVTLPAEIGAKDVVTWYEVDDGWAVVEVSLQPTDDDYYHRDFRNTRVYRLAADGTVQSSVDLALRNGAVPHDERVESALVAIVVPSPTLLLAGQAIAAEPGRPAGFAARLSKRLRQFAPFLAAVVLLSLGLAAWAWKRAEAFGLSRRERIVWTAFTALFGVPAFVGFLLHRHWPAREPCPHCHATVPRDRIACAACETPFPAPALRGTEIFA